MTPTTSPVTDIVTLVSVVMVICFLRKIIGIFPSLVASLLRWKESVNLSNSVKLNRDRNLIALVMIVPFCLVVTASGIYSPSFLSSMSEDARFGIILGTFVTMLIFRSLLERFLAPKRRNAQTYKIAKECGCKFYCASDAHHPDALDNAKEIIEKVIDHLGLTEDDKFPLVK